MLLTKPIQRRLERRRVQKRAQTYRALIRREAAIGGNLFGPLPKQRRREFVCLNKNAWVWHEEWVDAQNVWHMSTTRYDVRTDGIYKMQDGGVYTRISAQEAEHLRAAAVLYNEQVRAQMYTNVR